MSSDIKNSPSPGDDHNDSLVDKVTTILDAVPFLRSPLFPVY